MLGFPAEFVPYSYEYRYNPLLTVTQKPHYKWFDSPDYDDPEKKIWYASKWGLRFAIPSGIWMVSLAPGPLTTDNALKAFFRYAPPIYSSFVLGAACIVTVANLRQKDDLWNYAIGGAAPGLIWGFRHHCTFAGTRFAICWAFASILYKCAHTEKWEGYWTMSNSEWRFHRHGTFNAAPVVRQWTNMTVKELPDPGRNQITAYPYP